MANFFEGVGNLLKHPIDEAKWMWDSTKGVLSGDKKLKDIPGDHQEMMNNITVPLLGDNKISKNSDAVAGAIVGGILAAPAIGGFGTEGAFSKYFQPSLGETSLWDKIKGKANSLTDFGTEDLGQLFGDVDFDDPANDDILGMIADSEGKIAAGKKKGKGLDLVELGKMLQSVKPPPQQQISHSGRTGGGFRFDPSQYQNKLAQREFEQMYGAKPNKKFG